jgi:hypothetical protein
VFLQISFYFFVLKFNSKIKTSDKIIKQYFFINLFYICFKVLKSKKMKKNSILLLAAIAVFGSTKANAQINLGDKAMGALQKGVAGFMFSDEDAAKLSKQAVDKMDKENQVADLTGFLANIVAKLVYY